jgi:epoxide hydrolase 4
VAALIAHLSASSSRRRGGSKACVVGHDWGGVIAWHLASTRPELVDRLVILNAPHPARYKQLVRRPAQALRSWYVAFFQLPWLPELALRAAGLRPLDLVWRGAYRRHGALDARELAAYRAAFAPSDATRAAVNYYRAAVRHGVRVPADHRVVPHPTLVVWGMHDRALVSENAVGLERWAPRVRVVRVADAGHWVMTDAPDVVNAALLDFLSEVGAPVRTGSRA